MDNNNPTGPPAQPQQPAPVQQKAGMQLPPPQPMVQYPVQQVPPHRWDTVPFSKSWHVTKIVLGSMSIVFSIVLLGLGIYFMSTGFEFRAGFQFGLVGTTAALALIWQTSEFITVCASSRHRGIHPGANVALHLLIWIIAVVSVSFMAIYVSIDAVDIADASGYSGYSSYYRDELDWIEQLFAVEQAMLAFVTLLFIIHFTLFVRACVECHQYNVATRTLYLPMPVAAYGYYQAGPPQPQPYPYVVQQVPQQMAQPQMTQEQMAQQNQHYGYYAPPAPTVPAAAH